MGIGQVACSKCSQTGTIVLKDDLGEEYSDHCTCVKEKELKNDFESKLVKANIPKDFWGLTTDNYNNPANNKYDKVMNEINLQIIKRYIDNIETHFSQGTGLYLFGDNNTGKTMLMSIVLKEAIKKGFNVRFQTMSEIITGYMDNWFDKKDISVFKDCDLLAIDDSFDRRKTFTSSNQIQITQIDDLFRHRVHNWKSMMITANVSLNDLENDDSILNINLTRLMNRKMIELTFRGDFTSHLQDKVRKAVTGA